MKAFVHFCKNNNIPLDFISTHQYAGDPLGGVEDKGGPDEDLLDSKQAETISEQQEENVPEEFEAMKAMLNMDIYAAMPDGSCLDALRNIMPDKSETGELGRNVFLNNSAIVQRQAAGLPLFYTEWNFSATFSAYLMILERLRLMM